VARDVDSTWGMLHAAVVLLAFAGASLPESTETKKEPRWYGWQTAAADATGLGLVFTLGMTGGGQVMALPGVSLLVTPAIIHGLHGNTKEAIASIVMRLVLPLVGLGIGSQAICADDSCDGTFKGVFGGFLGASIGLGAAMIVDAVLAWDERPDET
jgi:hypothetical protein